MKTAVRVKTHLSDSLPLRRTQGWVPCMYWLPCREMLRMCLIPSRSRARCSASIYLIKEEGRSSPVDEVAEIVEKFRIVLGGEVNPTEVGILRLWPHIQQIEPPHVRWDACVPGVRPKHTHPSRL
ncbi:unnamed protein product [Timema podura]|uniref:Uncharacterized protein n=1 Tax=Timema podura TaxID=61482 RepID=A0ABN7NVU8_TIMPD|nr:unnamed protein product [Timema podura]